MRVCVMDKNMRIESQMSAADTRSIPTSNTPRPPIQRTRDLLGPLRLLPLPLHPRAGNLPLEGLVGRCILEREMEVIHQEGQQHEAHHGRQRQHAAERALVRQEVLGCVCVCEFEVTLTLTKGIYTDQARPRVQAHAPAPRRWASPGRSAPCWGCRRWRPGGSCPAPPSGRARRAARPRRRRSRRAAVFGFVFVGMGLC